MSRSISNVNQTNVTELWKLLHKFQKKIKFSNYNIFFLNISLYPTVPHSMALPLSSPLFHALGWANSAVTAVTLLYFVKCLHVFVCFCVCVCVCAGSPIAPYLFFSLWPPHIKNLSVSVFLSRFGFVSLTNCEILFRFLCGEALLSLLFLLFIGLTVRNKRSNTVSRRCRCCCLCIALLLCKTWVEVEVCVCTCDATTWKITKQPSQQQQQQ